MPRIAILAILAAALTVAPATAARAPLTMKAANRAADRYMAAEQAEHAPDDDSPEWYVMERYELEPCERTGRSHAECDVTIYWSDGDVCTDIIEIQAGRRRTHAERYAAEECASEPEGELADQPE